MAAMERTVNGETWLNSRFSRGLRLLVISAITTAPLAGCGGEKEEFKAPEHLRSKPERVDPTTKDAAQAVKEDEAMRNQLISATKNTAPALQGLAQKFMRAYDACDEVLRRAKLAQNHCYKPGYKADLQRESTPLFFSLADIRKELLFGAGRDLPRDTRTELLKHSQSVMDILMYEQTLGDSWSGNSSTSNSNISQVSFLKAVLAETIVDCAKN